jgi:hypothetical protein
MWQYIGHITVVLVEVIHVFPQFFLVIIWINTFKQGMTASSFILPVTLFTVTAP